jgi:hypothetical protein
LADIILRIGVYTKPSEGELTRALGRPFALHTDATLEPGYVIEYEMRLRNLSASCDCRPEVDVVSARAPQ